MAADTSALRPLRGGHDGNRAAKSSKADRKGATTESGYSRGSTIAFVLLRGVSTQNLIVAALQPLSRSMHHLDEAAIGLLVLELDHFFPIGYSLDR